MVAMKNPTSGTFVIECLESEAKLLVSLLLEAALKSREQSTKDLYLGMAGEILDY